VLYFLLRQLFVLADFVKKWPFNTLGLFLAGFICPYSFFIIMGLLVNLALHIFRLVLWLLGYPG